MDDLASNGVGAGGPAAIRGFRLQVLYALERLFGGAQRIRLEGIEDVDILGSGDELVELIQVKALGKALTLSALTSGAGSTGFFQRLNASDAIGARGGIVSFGPVGPELKGAFDGDDGHTRKVVRKLLDDYGLSNGQALLDRTELLERHEAMLYAKLEKQVLGLCPAASASTSLQLLCSWLLTCAEASRIVTYDDLLRQLQAAGEFAAECRAYAEEWFRTIQPLTSTGHQLRESLEKEFFEGISARHEHVLANIDVPRPRMIQAMQDGFARTRVVVLHGASGEGKSTLLFRYAEEHGQGAYRFLVDADADLDRSEAIGAALSSYAARSGAELLLLLDVRPGNRQWTRIVEQLASSSNVRILVGIREEDWREAHELTYRVRLTDVPVRLEEVEAADVFARLQHVRSSEHFLSFGEAWTTFGTAGPMLEFVYLVTKHQSLEARLREQVDALGRSTTGSELAFVRMAACGTGYAGRVSLRGLMEAASLDPGACIRLVRRLEDEYFIRRSNNGEWIEPVHSLRSRTLCTLLFDPVLCPLATTMVAIVPLIADDDLETFVFESLLLCEPKDLVVRKLTDLCIARTLAWRVLAGILRALLWLDLDEYVTTNKKFIVMAKFVMPGAWRFLLPWNFAPNWSPELSESLAEMRRLLMRQHPDRLAAAEMLANNVPPLTYQRVVAFLSRDWRTCPKPEATADWFAFDEIAFWYETLIPNGDGPAAAIGGSSEVPASLPILVQADIAGRTALVGSRQWREVVQRAVTRYRVVCVEDSDEGISVVFLLGSREARELMGEGDKRLNARAVDVVGCLRALVPGRAGYGAMARAWPVALFPHNPVHKRGMKPHLLRSKWAMRVVPVIMQMLERTDLPATWREHAEAVIAIRKGFLNGLQVALGKALADPRWDGASTAEEREDIVGPWTDESPTIPVCARDPWCVGDLTWREDQDEDQRWYSESYDRYIKVLQGFHTDAVGVMHRLAPVEPKSINWEAVVNCAAKSWEELGRLHQIDRAPLRAWWPDDAIDHQELLERTFLREMLCLAGARMRGEELRPAEAVEASKRETRALLGEIATRMPSAGYSVIAVDCVWDIPQRRPAIVIEPVTHSGTRSIEAAKAVCWECLRARSAVMVAEFRSLLERIELVVSVNGVVQSVHTMSGLCVLTDDRAAFLDRQSRPATREDALLRGLRFVDDPVIDELMELQRAIVFPALSMIDLLEAGAQSSNWNQELTQHCLDELAADLDGAVVRLHSAASQPRTGRPSDTEQITVLMRAEQAVSAPLDRRLLLAQKIGESIDAWILARRLENATRNSDAASAPGAAT